MEQQNQQPNQEKTEGKPPAKTNWKLLAIVASVAIIIAVAGILLLRQTVLAPPLAEQTGSPVPSPQPQGSATSAIKVGKVDIDYDSVSSLQALVDEGRQPWRLNPVMVAASEASSYGFTDEDKVTISTPDAETQQKFGTEITEIDLEISHDGKEYIMTLVQPVSGPGGIWVVSGIALKGEKLIADTSTWQTYRNEELGFEVKYPDDWLFRLSSQTFVPSRKSSFAIENTQNPKQWIQIEVGESRNDFASENDPLSNNKVDGIPARKFLVPTALHQAIGMPPPGSDFKLPSFPGLWVEKGGRFYSFVFYGTESIKGIYDQILSTFRFIP